MTSLLVKWFIRDSENVKDKKVRTAYGTLTSAVGVAVNLLLSVLKLTVGLLSSSVSIVADAVNNLSDAGSSVITFVSFRISSKPADRHHPHGHARMEYVTSMIVSMLVLVIGFELFTTSVENLIHPKEETGVGVLTAVLLGVAILFKLWLAYFNRKIGKKVDSEVMRATATDSLSDAASTFAVLCGVVVSLLFPHYAFTKYIDGAMGILVSVLILIAGLKILNETKNLILGGAPTPEEIAEITAVVSSSPEVLGVHDIAVHHYGPGNTVASVHAEVDGRRDMFTVHDEIDNIERRLSEEYGILCTIHVDPVATDMDTQVYREMALIAVKKIDPSFDIHDFRIVRGATHSNLIFDIAVPFECRLSDGAIRERVEKEIHDGDPHYYAVTHIDRV